MCEFIYHNLKMEEEQRRPNETKTSIGSPYNEITTALIQMGVNISDHDLIFAKMMRQLKMYRNVRVALLKAKDCPDVTSMIRSAVSQWLGEVHENRELDPDQDEEDDSDSDESRHRSWMYHETHRVKTTRRVTLDMQTLLTYLRNRPIEDRFSCIALLEDVECFSIMALQDFIMICGEYHLECPMAFVFGLATSIEIFRNSLSKTALCLLRTHGFQLQHPMTILTSLIDTLLIGENVFDSDGGFMLGWRSYKFLMDAVMLHHFSLEFFLKGLRYALMQHYRTNPLSFLGHSSRKVVGTAAVGATNVITDNLSTHHRVDLLTNNHLELLRQLPSFRKWTNSMIHERQPIRDALLRDDNYFQSHLAQILDYLRIYHRNYRLALDLFIRLQSLVDGTRKSKRILYLYGLEKHLFETTHYQQVMKRLG